MRVKCTAHLECDRELVPELAVALRRVLDGFDTEAELRFAGWPLELGRPAVTDNDDDNDGIDDA